MTALDRRAFLQSALAAVGIAVAASVPSGTSEGPAVEPLGAADSWDDPGADVLADIREARRLIERDTGLRSNVLVISENAYNVLVNEYGLDFETSTAREEVQELFGYTVHVQRASA